MATKTIDSEALADPRKLDAVLDYIELEVNSQAGILARRRTLKHCQEMVCKDNSLSALLLVISHREFVYIYCELALAGV
jgi:hypothetical protein